VKHCWCIVLGIAIGGVLLIYMPCCLPCALLLCVFFAVHVLIVCVPFQFETHSDGKRFTSDKFQAGEYSDGF
jgi:hypothetical protein